MPGSNLARRLAAAEEHARDNEDCLYAYRLRDPSRSEAPDPARIAEECSYGQLGRRGIAMQEDCSRGGGDDEDCGAVRRRRSQPCAGSASARRRQESPSGLSFGSLSSRLNFGSLGSGGLNGALSASAGAAALGAVRRRQHQQLRLKEGIDEFDRAVQGTVGSLVSRVANSAEHFSSLRPVPGSGQEL